MFINVYIKSSNTKNTTIFINTQPLTLTVLSVFISANGATANQHQGK